MQIQRDIDRPAGGKREPAYQAGAACRVGGEGGDPPARVGTRGRRPAAEESGCQQSVQAKAGLAQDGFFLKVRYGLIIFN